MRQRHRPTLRLLTWLAFVAMGLASFTPAVSQVLTARAMAAGVVDMADMPAGCPGHMEHSSPAAAPDHATGHGAPSTDACGYCSLMAHHPGIATLPVVLTRAPASAREPTLPAFPARARVTPWLFDAAPRGPPHLT